MKKYMKQNIISKTIVFLLHLPPPIHGSSMVGKWVRESKIINSNFQGKYINLLASKTVGDSGQVTVRKLLEFIKVWFQVLDILLFDRPAIGYLALSTTGVAFYKDVALVLLLKLFRVKRVYHLHNKGIQKASLKRLNKVLYEFAFSNATVIILSEHLYSDIAAYVPFKNIRICPNGVPKINISFKYKKNEDAIVQILFLSNLIKSKGVFILLEALAILKKRMIKFKAVFVGSEADISISNFNEEINRLNLLSEVSYLGKKFGQDKEMILQQSNILAFPTFYSKECLPLVLLEAMQYGLPIISCPEGGIPDVVKDGVNGYLVAQKDSVALADRLEELIKDPELRTTMGENGRQVFKEKFTLSIFERRLKQILEEVAEIKEANTI